MKFFTLNITFKNSFLPSVIIERNGLDHDRRSTASLSVFEKNLLEFIRPSRNYLIVTTAKKSNTAQDYA